MSKIFKTYLSFLSIILLTGVTNLHANKLVDESSLIEYSETFDNIKDVSFYGVKNEVYVYTSKQENKDNFLAEIIEIEVLEDEEISEEDHLFPTDAYQSTFFKIQLFDDLSFEEHKERISSKNHFYTASTKLYVKFQVFII